MLLSTTCAKTKSARNLINHTFLPRQIEIQKYGQYFQKLNLYSKKTENVQILFEDICVKIYAKFLRKNCAIYFLCSRLFKEL